MGIYGLRKPTGAYALIREAIANKLVVTAWYHGHYREMCPHVIGTKNGREHALLYQFGGTSSSGIIVPGSPQNWRCVDVDQLSDVSIKPGKWHTAHNHSRPQSCVDVIDLEVAY